MTNIDLNLAKQVAAQVADPELPFLTVADLGILREIELRGSTVIAKVSPTYSGCPAVQVIEDSILDALEHAGFDAIVERVMSPAWTTAWVTEEGRRKLRANGIAPPPGLPSASSADATNAELTQQTRWFSRPQVLCPTCDSDDTLLVSEFGSTPCKAQYKCRSCLEPFDQFKCL